MKTVNHLILSLSFCLQSSFISHSQESVESSSISGSRVFFTWTPASLIREERTLSKDKKFLKPAANRVLSFEPEIRVTNRFNLKIPFAFGLEFYKNGDINDDMLGNTPTFSSPSTYTISGHGQAPSYSKPQARVNDLIFQVGLAPKLYLNKSGQKGFYLTTAFLLGKMDKYSVTTRIYRETFETGYPAPNDKMWKETSRTNEMKKNPYGFFRWELGFGYQISEWKNISFIFETGFATMSRGTGKQNDLVYRNHNGNWQAPYVVQENNDIGFWGIRLSNRDYDSSWLKRNRLHFTNRFGIRYHFK